MISSNKIIFLADDDVDDCTLFEDALREVSSTTQLTTAADGIELMEILEERVPPKPDVIFLDLNMPRKNGLECLEQIKQTSRFSNIPIVIFSTSAQNETVNEVYRKGANYYICKPGSFAKLKSAIQQILTVDWAKNGGQPPRDKFLLSL